MFSSFQNFLSVKSRVVSHADVLDISKGVHSSRERIEGVVTMAVTSVTFKKLSLEVELRLRGIKAQS